jgi:PAS domain S-box-containing protein
VILTDANGLIEWVNSGFVRLTGYGIAEVVGRSPGLLQGPESDRTIIRQMHDAVAERRGFSVVLVNYHRNGTPYWTDIRVTPVFNADGRLIRFIGIQANINERKGHEAELERALAAEREMNAQQRRFISIASHEFRTPLAVIDGARQRIEARLGRDASDDIRKRLNRIRGSVSKMTEIIDRTLSSARLDEGRITANFVAFDIAGLLHEVIARQRSISAGLVIDVVGAAEPVELEGDPKLLDQVFTNLLSNAAKYSGTSKQIEVIFIDTTEEVEVKVIDHDIGVAQDEVHKLLTRFFRARTAMGIDGTGIGLHLVKELVSMHGGGIDVSSELRKGSNFALRLPKRWRESRPSVAAAE